MQSHQEKGSYIKRNPHKIIKEFLIRGKARGEWDDIIFQGNKLSTKSTILSTAAPSTRRGIKIFLEQTVAKECITTRHAAFKTVIHHDQIRFLSGMRGWFRILQSNHINKKIIL